MDVEYVSEDASALAREYERRFQLLPPGGGVIFVNVEAVPALRGNVHTFIIRLGISKSLDTNTGVAIIKKVMEKEMEEQRFTIQAAVFRGVSGASRDEDHEGSHSASS
jgi:Tfp pilus assembly protein PilN